MIDQFKNKKVVIVGNSLSLFEKKFGEDIDSYQIVCRINRGIVIKNSLSQGTKTDVWAYSIPRIVEDLFSTVTCENTIHLANKHRSIKVEGYKLKQFQSDTRTKYYYPVEWWNMLVSNLGFDKPSSGLMLLDLISRSEPKSITLYGFDWKESPTWYFQEATTEHNWHLEKSYIYKNFLNNDNIHLIR
jgi:hypothetical protein